MLPLPASERSYCEESAGENLFHATGRSVARFLVSVKLAAAAPPDVKELRIVEIEGYDIQADGGVHVKVARRNNQDRAVEIREQG